MSMLVANGATMMCSFGMAPSTLVVPPASRVLSGTPAANIGDCIPNTNIMPFGMCSSMANPTVAAATSAAAGVLTPQPCVPVIAGTWVPGSPTVLIGGKPALNQTCKCMCAYAGVIQIMNPGQTKTMVP
ncbi:MAG: DUF4280 domain-containing protein [Lachnospiraceae bacterium]|nr:DUF4280 domain-containing protein [Lachnospiraceae bacterium]